MALISLRRRAVVLTTMKSAEVSLCERKEEYLSPSLEIVRIATEQFIMGSGEGRNGDNETTEEEDLF